MLDAVAVEEGEGEVRLVHGCTAAPSPRQRPGGGLVRVYAAGVSYTKTELVSDL